MPKTSVKRRKKAPAQKVPRWSTWPVLISPISILLNHPRWKVALPGHRRTVFTTCNAVLREIHALPKAEKKRFPGYARHMVSDFGVLMFEQSIVLADDKTLRDLNKQFRGKDKPTNVLSFVGEGESLGEIVLSIHTIEREAKAQGKRVGDHFKHLLVHGTLHLLGADHEDDAEADAMEALEIKILKKLKVANPYL